MRHPRTRNGIRQRAPKAINHSTHPSQPAILPPQSPKPSPNHSNPPEPVSQHPAVLAQSAHQPIDSPPKLTKLQFSLPKRHPASNSEPQGAQMHARSPKAKIVIVKTIPCESFRAPGRSEARQSSQTVNFHSQNDALGAISNPRAPRSPPELPNR